MKHQPRKGAPMIFGLGGKRLSVDLDEYTDAVTKLAAEAGWSIRATCFVLIGLGLKSLGTRTIDEGHAELVITKHAVR